MGREEAVVTFASALFLEQLVVVGSIGVEILQFRRAVVNFGDLSILLTIMDILSGFLAKLLAIVCIVLNKCNHVLIRELLHIYLLHAF